LDRRVGGPHRGSGRCGKSQNARDFWRNYVNKLGNCGIEAVSLVTRVKMYIRNDDDEFHTNSFFRYLSDCEKRFCDSNLKMEIAVFSETLASV
jgi:hypothetical protein